MNEIKRIEENYTLILQGARNSMEENPCEYTAEKIKEYEFIIAALREKQERDKGIGWVDLKWFDEYYGHAYACPACGATMIDEKNYCADCGRKLIVD